MSKSSYGGNKILPWCVAVVVSLAILLALAPCASGQTGNTARVLPVGFVFDGDAINWYLPSEEIGRDPLTADSVAAIWFEARRVPVRDSLKIQTIRLRYGAIADDVSVSIRSYIQSPNWEPIADTLRQAVQVRAHCFIDSLVYSRIIDPSYLNARIMRVTQYGFYWRTYVVAQADFSTCRHIIVELLVARPVGSRGYPVFLARSSLQ